MKDLGMLFYLFFLAGCVDNQYNLIANPPPELSGVEISPRPLFTDSIATCDPGALVQSGDDEVELSFFWTVNDEVVDIEEPTLPGLDFFERGDEILCTVTPTRGELVGSSVDSDRVVVADSPPSAPVVRVTPEVPLPGEALSCEVTVPSEDADSDEITYVYAWSGDGEGEDADVAEDVTAGCEVWTCTVTPWANGIAGEPTSATVIVQGDDECLGCSLPGDIDGDGVADEVDNCVDLSNAEQSDIDEDGIGDVCDLCSLDGPRPVSYPDSTDYWGHLLSDVRINGGSTNVAILDPGESFSVSLNYEVYGAACSYCPGCVTQYHLGIVPATPCLEDDPRTWSCYYSGGSGCSASSASSSTFQLTAPTEPGMYFLRPNGQWHYSCEQAGYGTNWDDEYTVGAICVR